MSMGMVALIGSLSNILLWVQVLVGILISLLGLVSCTTSLSLWSFLVLSSICSVCYFKQYLSSSCLVLFFICTVVGGLLFLGGALSFSYTSWLINIGLLLKLGLAPFHFWLVKVASSLSKFPLFTLLGFLKVGPLYLLVSGTDSLFFWGSLSLGFGIILIFRASSVSYVLVGSGLILFWVLSTLEPWFFVPYVLAYNISLLLCCCPLLLSISTLIAFLSLSGLPPFPLFWVKLLILTSVPATTSFSLLLASALSLFPYTHLGLVLQAGPTTSVSLLFFYFSSFNVLLLLCFPLL